MPTFSYITQPLNDPDGESLEVSRGIIQQLAGKLGLRIDSEFVEEPGDAYVDWQNGKFRFARLEDRPIGRQVLAALQPGDALIVDNPMVEPTRLAAQISELAERGVEVHVARFELRGLPGSRQLAKALSDYFALERRFTSRRTQDGMLIAKLEGRSCGGKVAPGWKDVGPPEKRRRVPNEDERGVMIEIVKLRTKGWGFRKIASFLARERIMYRVSDRKRRNGYRFEFWSAGRCERAYHNMLQILAEDRAKQQVCSLASSV